MREYLKNLYDRLRGPWPPAGQDISSLLIDGIVTAALFSTVISTIGWIVQVSWLPQLFFPSMPMEWESSLALFFVYSAYWGYRHQHQTLSRIAALLALLIGIVAFGSHIIFSQPSFLPNFTSGQFSEARRSVSVSPQLSVAIVFSACAIVLLVRWTSALSLLWAGILSITVVVLGLSVLLGHLFQFRVAIRWSDAAAVSPMSALFLVVIGIFTAGAVWDEKRRLEKTASEAWRQFVLVAVAGVVLTALVSAIFSVLPLYDRLDTMRNRGLELELENRATRFRRWISELETVGAEIASRPSWEVLRAYYEKRITQAEYNGVVEDKTSEIRRLHPEIVGMQRLTTTQEALFSWGIYAPIERLSPKSFSENRIVLTPIELEGKLVLPLITPILDQHRSVLGWDVLYMSARGLLSTLSPLAEFHSELEPFLIVSRNELHSYSFDRTRQELVRIKVVPDFEPLIQAADTSETTGGIELQTTSKDPLIRLVVRTNVKDMYLAYAIPSAVLHREEDEKLLTFFLSVVLLALFGSSGVYFIIHHLLSETAALQFQVAEKNRLLTEASVERERIEGELSASRRQAALIFENSPVAIALFTSHGNIVSANPAFHTLFGLREDELKSSSLDKLIPDIRQITPSFGELNEPRRGEFTARRKSADDIKVEVQCVPVRMSIFHGVAVFIDDIQERSVAEAALRQSLREKELLLQEIHHRVKNNLQMISSLLSLQSRGITDDSLRRAFEDSQSRIRSIALLHDLLYKSKDLAQINFAAYLEALCSRLLISLGANNKVRWRLSIEDDLELPVDLALPSGLIVNELLTNAVKYASTNGSSEIVVGFSRSNGEYTLLVRDNGPGMPENFDIESSQSLGLRLVRSLVRQLGGTIQFSSNGGTCWTIGFTDVAQTTASRMVNHG